MNSLCVTFCDFFWFKCDLLKFVPTGYNSSQPQRTDKTVMAEIVSYPDATFKLPTPFVNLGNSSAYPKWTPINTKEQTSKVFRFTFYSTVGAYAWLTIWKRTAFLLKMPLSAVAFLTTAVGVRSGLANLREKNDPWNVFWASVAGSTALATTSYRTLPVATRAWATFLSASVIALFEGTWYAQSASSAGQDLKNVLAGSETALEKQQFWDVWKRRPLSQTVEELGVGRGILKP